MKKQESLKNKTVNRFIALLATIDSPDPVSDVEMELTKKLIDQMLIDYKFLSQYKDIYYRVTDEGIKGGKHLMSEIHKAWDALLGRKVSMPYNLYTNPEENLVWMLKDNNWSPKDRMVMIASAMKFLHENKSNELLGNSNEHLTAFAYIDAVAEILRETPTIKGEIVKDPSYFWNKLEHYLHEVFSRNVFVGDSQGEVNALRNMHNVMGMMWKTQSYATAFPPAVETVVETTDQVTTSEVQPEGSVEEE